MDSQSLHAKTDWDEPSRKWGNLHCLDYYGGLLVNGWELRLIRDGSPVKLTAVASHRGGNVTHKYKTQIRNKNKKGTRSWKRKEKTARRNPKLPYGCCLIRAGSPVKSTAFGKWTVGTNEATNQHTTQRPDTEHNTTDRNPFTQQNTLNRTDATMTQKKGGHML